MNKNDFSFLDLEWVVHKMVLQLDFTIMHEAKWKNVCGLEDKQF